MTERVTSVNLQQSPFRHLGTLYSYIGASVIEFQGNTNAFCSPNKLFLSTDVISVCPSLFLNSLWLKFKPYFLFFRSGEERRDLVFLQEYYIVKVRLYKIKQDQTAHTTAIDRQRERCRHTEDTQTKIQTDKQKSRQTNIKA